MSVYNWSNMPLTDPAERKAANRRYYLKKREQILENSHAQYILECNKGYGADFDKYYVTKQTLFRGMLKKMGKLTEVFTE